MQRTCAALEEHGFFAVRTMECLLRQYEVRQEKMTLVDEVQGVNFQQGKMSRGLMSSFLDCRVLLALGVRLGLFLKLVLLTCLVV